jgi:tetratricopeptide (TPR) repeat protein
MQKNTPGKKPKQKKRVFLFYLLAGAAAFIVYINALPDGFVFDDESVVVGNQSITHLSNIPKYFSAQEGFHKVIGRYYRPVISSTYALDYALGGLNPLGFHLTNVIIHIINTLLVLKLLLLIFGTEDRKISKNLLYAAFFGALIFAVHPIHTEAVTWVSGRTDSLSFTFFAAAFIYYIKYSRFWKPLHLILLLLYYILSLLSKEMAITFPVVVILYDIMLNNGLNKEFIKKHFPAYSVLAVVSVIYLFFRWLILKDVPQRETYFYFYHKDLLTVILTMLQTIPLYFRLLVVPIGLLYHYNGYLPYVSSFASISVIYSIIFILFALGVALFMYKKFPVVSFSILIVFITLLPVMNIVPTMNFMAERFLYIPSLALSFVIALLFIKLGSGKSYRVLFSLVIILAGFYSYLTYQRNFDWKDNNTLFLSADDKPGTVVYVNIGNIYGNNHDYDKAEVYYRKALDLRNETLLANTNLGKIFLIKGNFDSAYYYIYKSYKLDTLSPEPMLALAQLYANFKMLPEAIKWLEKIQTITPNYMNSSQMLAELKQEQQEGGNVIRTPVESLKIAALEKDSYKNYQEKNYDKAVEELKELIKINPAGKAGYYNNIGISYLERGMLKEAKEYFEKAVEEKSDFSTAYNNLGSVYEKMGDKIKARESYKKALDADPNNQTAKNNLNKLK